LRADIDRPERDAFRLAFGQNLKLLRTTARLSQGALAARCFLRDDSVSRLERGGASPRLELLVLIAAALGVSVGELTEGLAAPARAAGLERALAALAEQPGSATSALAISAELPERYVWQLLRYLTATRQIRREGGGWQTR
jgi:transcriptional regulator with XRE-family HTH domain